MPVQRSFEELGVPLADVTFCVLDLETTGGSPADCGITEVGACKVRRGEVVGTFHTLVNPGQPVPAFIRLLTGISDELLIEAPDIETVLPSLLEFVRDSVIVAHNARFDVGFINCALQRADRPRLANRVVDTAILARKILSDEVPNHKLSTLARHLRCAHQPNHRAYTDVLATIDVLHHLIERVAGFGVTTLEDLVAMTSARIDRTFAKIRLADDVPRAGGVYRFIGVGGETLYVGKAADLRARVRSYFYGDPRRKVRDLLRQVDRIEVETHPTMLEAEVAEARAIASELPPHNRAGKRHASWYLKLHIDAKVPKLTTARVPKEDGSLYLGPFAGVRVVKTLIAGLQDAYRIHRCSEPARCRGCAFSEMKTCAGTDRGLHGAELDRLARSLATDAEEVFVALEAKMRRMSAVQRYEEATDTREQGAALERALQTEVLVRSLVEAGDVVLRIGKRLILLRDGQLAAAADVIPADPVRQIDALQAEARSEPVGAYVPSAVQREARVIARWLTRNAASCELVCVTGRWALPLHAGRLGDRFRPRSEP
ncbi:MAG TPA: DEDD exonuclease domain-containing protein [Actinomycetota bacterium]|nr:DEDD exonuclease domain-containing protein [Actinomycetota bacterium]